MGAVAELDADEGPVELADTPVDDGLNVGLPNDPDEDGTLDAEDANEGPVELADTAVDDALNDELPVGPVENWGVELAIGPEDD